MTTLLVEGNSVEDFKAAVQLTGCRVRANKSRKEFVIQEVCHRSPLPGLLGKMIFAVMDDGQEIPWSAVKKNFTFLEWGDDLAPDAARPAVPS